MRIAIIRLNPYPFLAARACRECASATARRQVAHAQPTRPVARAGPDPLPAGPCRFFTSGGLRPLAFSLTAVGRRGAQTPQSLCRCPTLLAPFDHLPGYRGAPARLLWLLSGRLRRTSSIFTPPISAVLALARSRLKPANS